MRLTSKGKTLFWVDCWLLCNPWSWRNSAKVWLLQKRKKLKHGTEETKKIEYFNGMRKDK